MPARDPEIQTRTCRACNQAYEYPVRRSPATRFYCDLCALLPEGTRAVIERLNRRLRELERQGARTAAAKQHG